MAEELDPQVQIRIMDLAFKLAEAALPAVSRGEQGLKKYAEYFDTAYKAIAKTIAGS
jgi:hypothetical protein